MMIKLNLLPWREQKQKQLRNKFYVLLTKSLAAIALGSGIFYIILEAQIKTAGLENQHLKTQVVKEREHGSKKNKTLFFENQIKESQKIITKLKKLRLGVVGVLEVIASSIPEEIALTEIEKKEDRYFLKGISTTTDSVPVFLEKLKRSKWIKSVFLTALHSETDNVTFFSFWMTEDGASL